MDDFNYLYHYTNIETLALILKIKQSVLIPLIKWMIYKSNKQQT